MSDDNNITNELLEEILRNVKLILNIKDNSKDALLQLYINALCTNILIKTNRRKFLPEMKYIIIDLVVDKLDNNINSSSKDLNEIQSMSEAGRSVNFGVSSVVASRLNLLAQKQLDENDNLINKFKLLYKI